MPQRTRRSLGQTKVPTFRKYNQQECEAFFQKFANAASLNKSSETDVSALENGTMPAHVPRTVETKYGTFLDYESTRELFPTIFETEDMCVLRKGKGSIYSRNGHIASTAEIDPKMKVVGCDKYVMRVETGLRLALELKRKYTEEELDTQRSESYRNLENHTKKLEADLAVVCMMAAMTLKIENDIKNSPKKLFSNSHLPESIRTACQNLMLAAHRARECIYPKDLASFFKHPDFVVPDCPPGPVKDLPMLSANPREKRTLSGGYISNIEAAGGSARNRGRPNPTVRPAVQMKVFAEWVGQLAEGDQHLMEAKIKAEQLLHRDVDLLIGERRSLLEFMYYFGMLQYVPVKNKDSMAFLPRIKMSNYLTVNRIGKGLNWISIYVYTDTALELAERLIKIQKWMYQVRLHGFQRSDIHASWITSCPHIDLDDKDLPHPMDLDPVKHNLNDCLSLQCRADGRTHLQKANKRW